MYIDKLENIINKNNDAYRTIKMKPIDVNYIAFYVENNDKFLKFKVGGHKRISKYKKYFCKRLHPKLSSRSFYD